MKIRNYDERDFDAVARPNDLENVARGYENALAR
jgi:hypothetical protein